MIVRPMSPVPDYNVLILYRLASDHRIKVCTRRTPSGRLPRVINFTWEMAAQQPQIAKTILIVVPVKRTGLDQHRFAGHGVRHHPVLVSAQARAHGLGLNRLQKSLIELSDRVVSRRGEIEIEPPVDVMDVPVAHARAR